MNYSPTKPLKQMKKAIHFVKCNPHTIVTVGFFTVVSAIALIVDHLYGNM